MTTPATTAEPAARLPGPDTPVLVDRPLNPHRMTARMSVFADDVWDITPGLFEAHVPAVRLKFQPIPDRFRDAAKLYIWHLVNHDDPHRRRATRGRQLALRSITLALTRLGVFLHWLDTHGMPGIADVTAAHLDQHAADVAALEASTSYRGSLLVEVRRLWSYRSLLPEPLRLPAPVPWGSDLPAELLGGTNRPRENRTARIAADTMEPLLMWCLRFVDVFAADIIAAFHEYLRLWARDPGARNNKRGYAGNHGRPAQAQALLHAWLVGLRQTGQGLPGRTLPTGERGIDWPHLCRLFDLDGNAFDPGRRLRRIVDEYGLPVGDDARLDTPITGHLHTRPWRATRIGYTEAPALARLLSTACMIMIAYLTGMRPGEVLNLERGCVEHDPVAGPWLVTGRHWKGARDHNGNKIPEGAQRPDPWTTVKQVADAVAVLERLHPHQLLFTAQLLPRRTSKPWPSTRTGHGRTSHEMRRDTTDLIRWINEYCDANGLPEQRIPPDPHGEVVASPPRPSHDLRLRPRQGPVPATHHRRRRTPDPRPGRLPPHLPEHRLHRPGHRPTAPPRRAVTRVDRRPPCPLATPPSRTRRTRPHPRHHPRPRPREVTSPHGHRHQRVANARDRSSACRHPRRRRPPPHRHTAAVHRQPLHRPTRHRGRPEILDHRPEAHRPARPLPTPGRRRAAPARNRQRLRGTANQVSRTSPALRRPGDASTDLRHGDQRTFPGEPDPSRAASSDQRHASQAAHAPPCWRRNEGADLIFLASE
jgi:hypothetical protein